MNVTNISRIAFSLREKVPGRADEGDIIGTLSRLNIPRKIERANKATWR
jgi:hypothetical protein